MWEVEASDSQDDIGGHVRDRAGEAVRLCGEPRCRAAAISRGRCAEHARERNRRYTSRNKADLQQQALALHEAQTILPRAAVRDRGLGSDRERRPPPPPCDPRRRRGLVAREPSVALPSAPRTDEPSRAAPRTGRQMSEGLLPQPGGFEGLCLLPGEPHSNNLAVGKRKSQAT